MNLSFITSRPGLLVVVQCIALGSVPTFCIVEHTILNARTFEITLT